MAKQGMKRPERTHIKPKNDQPPVPEIQGKAKHGKEKAAPISLDALDGEERPIPDVYKAIDNDLARDNLENDLPAGDLEDL